MDYNRDSLITRLLITIDAIKNPLLQHDSSDDALLQKQRAEARTSVFAALSLAVSAASGATPPLASNTVRHNDHVKQTINYKSVRADVSSALM